MSQSPPPTKQELIRALTASKTTAAQAIALHDIERLHLHHDGDVIAAMTGLLQRAPALGVARQIIRLRSASQSPLLITPSGVTL